ncbi:MAG: TIGR01212 family radical SAM protein [Fibrobacterota bacterium]
MTIALVHLIQNITEAEKKRGGYPYSLYLKRKFHAPVRKITVDAGFDCPNRDGRLSREGCFFCDNNAFSPAVKHRGMPVREQVLQALEQFHGSPATRFIAYFQPYTNTYAAPERLRSLYREALCDARIVGLAVATRPDCVDENVIEVFRELKKETDVSIEFGVQTANEMTLRRINRGHGFEVVPKAAALCRAADVEFGFHVILGLPGEGREDACRTAEVLQGLGHSTVKIHHFHVCKGTRFEQEFRDGKITVPEMEDHAAAVVDFLERTLPNVAVQRLMGDCPKAALVAPAWTLDRPALTRAVEAEFSKRGTAQGAKRRAG